MTRSVLDGGLVMSRIVVTERDLERWRFIDNGMDPKHAEGISNRLWPDSRNRIAYVSFQYDTGLIWTCYCYH